MSDYIELEETPRRFYTMIPNLIDDLGMDVYCFRLYAHLRRVAGEFGACWQSTETLSAACCMSPGMVSGSKIKLQHMGLIDIEERRGEHGTYHHITIRDVWAQNNARYQAEGSYSEPKGSYSEPKGSPGETKNNPLRRTPEEEP